MFVTVMTLSNYKGPFILDLDDLCNIAIYRLFLAFNSMRDNNSKGISRRKKELKKKRYKYQSSLMVEFFSHHAFGISDECCPLKQCNSI